MPATGSLIGTPASISASVPPQTDAMLLTSRWIPGCRRRRGSCRGTSPAAGMTALRLRSARAPWPISRRPGPRIGLHSPTLERREVVIEHELLAVLFHAGRRRAARRWTVPSVVGDQRLRFAALEEGRAVRARQHADLAGRSREAAWACGRRCACLPGSGRGRRALPERSKRLDNLAGVYLAWRRLPRADILPEMRSLQLLDLLGAVLLCRSSACVRGTRRVNRCWKTRNERIGSGGGGGVLRRQARPCCATPRSCR